MNWAPVLGRCQEPGRFTEPAYFLGLVSGPTRLFFKPNQFSNKKTREGQVYKILDYFRLFNQIFIIDMSFVICIYDMI